MKLVPWDREADCDCGVSGNLEPGATLVPAPGGGGSNTPVPVVEDPVPVPRDRGLDEDDVVAGMSEPSADFFVLIQHTINTLNSNTTTYYYYYY